MINNSVNDHAHFSDLKMCVVISDLFLFVFHQGNVSNEMWC